MTAQQGNGHTDPLDEIRIMAAANRPGPYRLGFIVGFDGQFHLDAPAEEPPSGSQLHPGDVADMLAWASMRWAAHELAAADAAGDLEGWRSWMQDYERALLHADRFDSCFTADGEPPATPAAARWSVVWVTEPDFTLTIEELQDEGARPSTRDKFHVAVSALAAGPDSVLSGWILQAALAGLRELSASAPVRTDPVLQEALVDVLYGTAVAAHRFGLDYAARNELDPTP